MKNLEARVAGLEAQAGIGVELPEIIVIMATFVNDEDRDQIQHAGTTSEGREVAIHRKKGESFTDFTERTYELGRSAKTEPGCLPLVWMR